MRGVLAAKALFMIVVLVMVTFTVSDLSQVKAEEQKACCEVTNDGDTCVYTDSTSCNPEYLTATSSCEQTSYCEVGCCISPEGICSKSVSKSTCEAVVGYTWYEGAACEVSQCQKNCCVVGGAECAYTTQAYCSELTAAYEDLTLDWRAVASEAECSDVCTGTNKGCCVTSDACTFTTKELCTDSQIDMTTGNGFYDEMYCSDIGGCGCVEHAEKKCVGEDVYWFDSCGNQEDIAENCDYPTGTLCGTYENEATCLSTACSDTFDGVYSIDGVTEERNTHDSKFGGVRENGETWCVYEGPAGGWFDRPGSRHYRAICQNGEEVLEPCQDNREEVCIQYPYTSYYNTTILEGPNVWSVMTNELMAQNQEYGDFVLSGAACLDNGFYQTLINANVTTVPAGDNSVETCAKGTQTCPVTFARSSYYADWECVANCFCLTPEWADKAAGYCSIQGDCGAKYNLVNQLSDDGFYIWSDKQYVGHLDGEEVENATMVGYDTGCIEEFREQGDNTDCIDMCNNKPLWRTYIDQATKQFLLTGYYEPASSADFSVYGLASLYQVNGEEGCYFINGPTDDYTEQLNDNYGVYGGMIGFSKTMEAIGYQVADLGLESAWWAVGAGVAAGIATAIIWAATGAATTITLAAGSSGLLVSLLSIAGVSSTVPIAGWVVAAVAVIVAIIVYIVTAGGEEMTVNIVANCEPWVAPTGSDYCELCDVPVSEGGLAIDDGSGNILEGYECSQYKCESLGGGCKYITENEGSTRAKCVANDANDVNAPIIENAYLLGDYKDLQVEFVKDKQLIVKENIEPYTFFEFGIDTDEVSQCKIQIVDINNGELPSSFDAMTTFFSNSYFDYVHNQTWTLLPGQQYDFYINCQDVNGNNRETNNFLVRVNVNEGADMMPPSIEATSIVNGGYVPAGVTQTDLTIFLDEPGNCKWSNLDNDYTLMENYFVCSGVPTTASPYFDNGCTASLTVAEGMNTYYFACEDAVGNINTDNYVFNLQSTIPLLIDYSLPSGTLYYDYTELYVQTSGGAENGKAVCSYNGINFYETEASTHRQPLENLVARQYDYNIMCTDVAGNQNTTSISFTIEVDDDAPQLIALYKSDSNVYFQLDETASCEYAYDSFVYGEGTDVANSFAVTDAKEYYLICEDVFGNQGSWEINI